MTVLVSLDDDHNDGALNDNDGALNHNDGALNDNDGVLDYNDGGLNDEQWEVNEKRPKMKVIAVEGNYDAKRCLCWL